MNINSERLLLRPIHINDKEEILAYRSDVEANKYQGWIPKTIADVTDFLEKLATTPNQPETWYQLAIIEKESGKLIGDIGIHFIGDENQKVELGYTVDKMHQRKGYASEALKVLINDLFFELKKHRISASVDPANVPSTRLLEKLGFRKEAHFVESYYQNGIWVDDVVYALLSCEWKNTENIP